MIKKTVCGVTVSVKPFNSSSHSGASVGVLFLVDVGDQQGREFLLKHYLTCVNQDLGLWSLKIHLTLLVITGGNHLSAGEYVGVSKDP